MTDTVTVQGYANTASVPEYECPKHGNIGNTVLNSTLPGLEMSLCLHCYIEKLVEIGVHKVERVR